MNKNVIRADEKASKPLAGQVALVTGGGRGVGRVIATHLANAGATLAICARTKAEINEASKHIERIGGRAEAFQLDVTDRRNVSETIEEIEKTMGAVDLLVNNAGVPGPLGPTWEVDPSDWWKTFEVHVNGTFNCSRAVLPQMIIRHSGRIINIVSHAGVERWPLLSAYAVSKSAVIKLTENLAFETRKFGVKVFAFHPGILRIGISQWTSNADDVQPESDRGKVLAWLRKQFAEGKDVPPERAADLVVYLSSGAADLLSGRYISVYDNIEMMIQRADEIREKELYTLRLRM